MHYVYFLWSEKLKKIYIGENKNVLNRLDYHNKGLQRFTKRGIPWKLIGVVEFKDRKEALKEEKRLKKCKNRDYYKKYLLEKGGKLSG
ncbi:MAG: GIY-YIG nuclease family protein [Candidatus Magasanikbacteria bacterium]|nr:GIY-YIG nuclease family protein [Candidatus Magasanikbacteria bacterium]